MKISTKKVLEYPKLMASLLKSFSHVLKSSHHIWDNFECMANIIEETIFKNDLLRPVYHKKQKQTAKEFPSAGSLKAVGKKIELSCKERTIIAFMHKVAYRVGK